MIYAYKKNGGLRPPIPPDQAAAEINRVLVLCKGEEKDLPGMLVKESKKKTSVLHSTFNWNDAQCGELWRTHQARLLIATVYIIEGQDDGEDILVPAFPSIAGTENRLRSYEPIEVAMASDEMREELLNDVRQRLKMLRNKYKNLTELAAIWDVIDKVAG
jgi:hypothetical protein